MATGTKKKASKPLGPRVTVLFSSGTGKTGNKNNKYVFMRKETADYFGFKIVVNPVIKTKAGYELPVRGTTGAGSIKVPLAKSGTAKGGTKVVRYRRIPVPASANISQIRKFLQTATRNKPEQFASTDGRTHPVGGSKTK
jgi:hypothetical protein